MLLIAMVVIVVVAVVVLSTGRQSSDGPGRVVVVATKLLPANRRAWGQAMVAEMAPINGVGRRWRFAAGVLRVALFPPAPSPTRTRLTAIVGVAATLVATAAAFILLPTLTVFVVVFGLLSSGCATAISCRSVRIRPGGAALAAGIIAAAAVIAVASAVIVIAVDHPAATQDQTHLFSVALAVTLSVYLTAGLSATFTGSATAATSWGGLAGAGVAVAVSTVVPSGAVFAVVSPITAIVALATAVVVSIRTRSRRAGARAGLLAAVLSAPIEFAIALLSLDEAGSAALTNPYDIAAFASSGYPDAASYLLSDALGGTIVSLAVTPLVVYALASLGAAAAPRLRAG
jgi:hypothetical protein